MAPIAFQQAKRSLPWPKTSASSKDAGGRNGGYDSTDAGLAFAGIDAENFRQKEALDYIKSQQDRAEQARKVRDERIHSLQKEIEEAATEQFVAQVALKKSDIRLHFTP